MNKYIKNLQQLKGIKFWKYFLKHKSELKLTLDNDSTIVTARDSDGEDEEYADCPDYLGNSYGLSDFLEALDIEFEHC